MVLKQVLILTFIVTQAVFAKVPFSLIEDAEAELDTLRQTIIGLILVADDKLDSYNLDLQIKGQNTANTAHANIATEQTSVAEQVRLLKELANSAKVNISYCLQGREDYLNKLPDAISDELVHCINGEVEEGSKVTSQFKYLIDISINNVEAIDFRLKLCDPDSESCISAIVEEIRVESERLPQDIEVLVQEAEELFESLKVLVSNCADLKVSQYVSSANTILRDLTNCVNNLLG